MTAAPERLWVPPPRTLIRPSMTEIRARTRHGMVAVGSFSGAGGSALGLRMAGWTVPVAVEFVPEAAETYRANFQAAEVFEQDVRTLTADVIRATLGMRVGELDLFEGSPPCASFSPAGMRERGWGKTRSYSGTEQRTDDLFWVWMRLLEDLRPRAFIAENVPGMLSGNALVDYTWAITEKLRELGYYVSAAVINAANFGVPQDRRRILFVGLRDDHGFPRVPLIPGPTTPEPFTLRHALESVDPQDSDHAPFLEASSMEGYATGRTWEWMTGRRVKENCARCGEPLRDHRSEVKEVWALRRLEDRDGTREKLVYFCADGEDAVEVKDYSRFYVPELDRPCITLTAAGWEPTSASVVHPTENRKFTPAEMKAICGFPADFELTGTRIQRCERMGRAVPPPVYEAVGRRIAEALS